MMKIPTSELLYVDTDSITFTGDHIDKFKISDEMGDWKIEQTGDAHIVCEKRYRVGMDTKIAGVPRRQINMETLEQPEIFIEKMISLKQGMNLGDLDLAGQFRSETVKIEQHKKGDMTVPNVVEED